MNNISFRSLLVIAPTLGFYTNILIYLTQAGFTPILPFYYLILFGVISVSVILPPFFTQRQIPKCFSIIVMSWMLFFLLISLVWFIASGMSEVVVSVFLKRVMAILVFSFFLFIFSGGKKLQNWARRALLLSVCITILSVIYEFFFPFSLVPNFSEYANPGRSAGFYVNANHCGAALVFGMIFSVGLLPSKYRGVYVLSVLIAVLLTFSRSALVGWLLVCLAFVKVNILNKRVLLFIILGLGIIYFLLLPLHLNFIHSQDRINVTNIIERLNWIHNPFKLSDASSAERKYVIKLAWKMFMDSPLWGNGIGSALTWVNKQSTHNMYLYFMMDHGFIGFFILPFFVISVIWKARGAAKQIALPFLVFSLFWGIVSHNIMGAYYFLIGSALMAVITQRSRFSNDKLT